MRLGIIGAGRVGASFVLAFPSDVEGILCSTEESTLQKARRLHVTAYTDGAELARHCDVLLLTVRDDVLASVSQQLAASLKEDGRLSHRCVFHCSGAMNLSPLESLASLGIHTGSIHPLQSFAGPSMDRLKGIYMAVDGDEQARGVAERIVRTLGSTPFFVPSEERMLYHAAACFCSNYVVTALALAQQLMRRWTASDDDAAKALMPLVDGTLQNVRERNVWQTALTGPVSRGDVGTIVKHLAVMPGELIHPYCAFGRAAADLALKNETITAQQHDELTRILAMAEGVYYEQKSNQSDH
ncbi:DUF2520 domain-containing protein [Megasphaera elsdenii]|uniref:Rossmann-like and DUF2520 domain-containing protein n=1 Tax=Megasphaera elsdenii TaxID=907 RepID=UPI001D031DB3|nr:Rossmann-like and DUF2520 domain-containing protein [Megasphaera elsdenii]MCB5701736.1 DUF2520 domain-containing protein [Megasphaera elsdenii]MCB5726497.1 DUF2520 domain-containing protein [Megasphaera elsdenii]MCB5770276.1 DUF2520 domain-containing protein [Megasphaera elsdenii]